MNPPCRLHLGLPVRTTFLARPLARGTRVAYAYQLKTRALPILRGTRGTARVEALAAEVVQGAADHDDLGQGGGGHSSR